MDFIQLLQKYVYKVGYQNQELHTALDCLTGEAKNWSKIYTHQWEGFKNFKADFLKQYWGRERSSKSSKKGSGKSKMKFSKWT